jgi:hypothetical protein
MSGSDLAGLLTRRAAERLHAAGIVLGRAVALGTPPEGVPVDRVFGDLVRVLGDVEGHVRAVVTRDPRSGAEVETPCDTAIFGLGSSPRDALARMVASGGGGTGGAADAVQVVGPAADDHPLPDPPSDPEALACGCMDVTVGDLDAAWEAGYRNISAGFSAVRAASGLRRSMSVESKRSCVPLRRLKAYSSWW